MLLKHKHSQITAIYLSLEEKGSHIVNAELLDLLAEALIANRPVYQPRGVTKTPPTRSKISVAGGEDDGDRAANWTPPSPQGDQETTAGDRLPPGDVTRQIDTDLRWSQWTITDQRRVNHGANHFSTPDIRENKRQDWREGESAPALCLLLQAGDNH
ncbi:hypothetical protein RRG08_026362 [Elysia crispata]|uniref:Uncharacterized protein n=1 Tax=Elysia crispata TaxID=231223 RepID=A0AAE0XN21_9GAST|nr:hypothetical protein RRG08_026362 [Elysia crispata]